MDSTQLKIDFNSDLDYEKCFCDKEVNLLEEYFMKFIASVVVEDTININNKSEEL